MYEYAWYLGKLQVILGEGLRWEKVGQVARNQLVLAEK